MGQTRHYKTRPNCRSSEDYGPKKLVKLWFYKLAAAGLAAILKAGQYFPKVLLQSRSGMVKKEKCQNKPKTATLYELHKKATIVKKLQKI